MIRDDIFDLIVGFPAQKRYRLARVSDFEMLVGNERVKQLAIAWEFRSLRGRLNSRLFYVHDCMEAGGTRPWMGEDRTMQDAIIENDSGDKVEDVRYAVGALG